MDIQEKFKEIFDVVRNPDETVITYRMATGKYEFTKHAGHDELGICLVTDDQGSAQLWLFGRADDLPGRYHKLAANEYSEQSTDVIHSLRYNAPKNKLWEKTAPTENWSDGEWPPAYLRAKGYLTLKLADLIAGRLEIHTPAGIADTTERCNCGSEAAWVRRTQFSGDHYFCDEHAREEENFGKSDSSYFFWESLTKEEATPPATI